MKDPTPASIELWGGTLCLDLANSTDWDARGVDVDPERNDVLRSAAMLASWSDRVGVLGTATIDDDELQRELDALDLSQFTPAQSEAVRELREELAKANGGGELEMVVRETLEAIALG